MPWSPTPPCNQCQLIISLSWIYRGHNSHLLRPLRTSTNKEPGDQGRIVHALDRQVPLADPRGELLEERRTNQSADIPQLGGAAGKDDGYRLAGAIKHVLGECPEVLAGLQIQGRREDGSEKGEPEDKGLVHLGGWPGGRFLFLGLGTGEGDGGSTDEIPGPKAVDITIKIYPPSQHSQLLPQCSTPTRHAPLMSDSSNGPGHDGGCHVASTPQVRRCMAALPSRFDTLHAMS